MYLCVHTGIQVDTKHTTPHILSAESFDSFKDTSEHVPTSTPTPAPHPHTHSHTNFEVLKSHSLTYPTFCLTDTPTPSLWLCLRSEERMGHCLLLAWQCRGGTEVSGSWLSLLSHSPWDCRQYYRTHTVAHTHTHTHPPEEQAATTHSI